MVVRHYISVVGDDDTRSVSLVLLTLDSAVDNHAEESLIERGDAGHLSADVDHRVYGAGCDIREVYILDRS